MLQTASFNQKQYVQQGEGGTGKMGDVSRGEEREDRFAFSCLHAPPLLISVVERERRSVGE